jgi:hypothetical protein
MPEPEEIKTEVAPELQWLGGAKPLPERLPRPTVWPAALSLGITLLSFGIVTHWIMSVFGFALFLVAAIGWFGDLRNDVLL